MKTIRVNFASFWPNFNLGQFRGMFAFLGDRYQFVQSDNPQVVFESVFPLNELDPIGRQRWPNARQVFFTGENRGGVPLDHYDYCITFHRDIQDPRHLRMPFFVPNHYANGGRIADLIKNNDSPPQPTDLKKRTSNS